MPLKTQPEITVAATRAKAIADVAGVNKSAVEVIIHALSTNTGITYIGDDTVTTSTGLPLPAGAERTFPIVNTGQIYAIGTAGDKLRVASIVK